MRLLGLLIGKGKPKVENYLFLQRMMINALDIVFSGYKTGEYFFIPPDPILEGYYRYIHERYSALNSDPEVNNWLKRKGLATLELDMFRSLSISFDFGIEQWNVLKDEALKEKKFLDGYVPHGGNVTDEIKLKAYEMEEWLEEHKKWKESEQFKRLNPVFLWRNFSLDTKIGKIALGNDSYDINPSAKEYKMLVYLIQHVGEIVRYREIASVLGLNSYRENVSNDTDVARSVQEYKKVLMRSLNKLGIKKSDVKALIDAIESVTNTGYRLQK
jgi:DNA-binding winged helix-turn-helix (wHTH) protein